MFNPNMYGFAEIDTSGLVKLMESGQIDLIDVRSEGEVAYGIIDGARHIPLHLLPLKASEMDRNAAQVYYCRTGARSAQACAFMAAQGHKQCYNLQGGIMAWMQSGQGLGRSA
ncbi:MAG: rhodanese-like domain-containing protein [Sulfuricella sp.]|nr:rhodanese-like domain-containing protein [Sulfuricella sp.]